MNTTAFTCALGVVRDLAQRARRCARDAPSSARSAREVTPSAASIAAIRPPKATSSDRGDEEERSGHARLRRRSATWKPTRRSLLQAEHLPLLLGLGVVEAEQVQEAVRR